MAVKEKQVHAQNTKNPNIEERRVGGSIGRDRLTKSATLEAVSKWVGKSSLICELMEAWDHKAFERCQQMWILSGAPGC